MDWYHWLYVILIYAAAAVAAGLAVYAWRHRDAPGATAFTGLMLAIAGWLFSVGLLALSRTPQTALFWFKTRFIVIASVPVVFLAFVLQYTGRERWLTRRRLASLLVVPLMTQVAVWTNQAHRFFYQSISFIEEGPLISMDWWTSGFWFWVHAGYSYLLLLIGMVLIVLTIVRAFHLYRRQAMALLLGALLPWAANVIDTFDLIPQLKQSVAPFGFMLMGLAFAWALFRYRLLDLVPVARDALIDSMSDGMLVLDEQNRIVDLNPAAQSIIGISAGEAIGQPAAQILRSWQDFADRLRDKTEAQAEITLDRSHYDLRISSLSDRRGRFTGRLIVLRDITQRKKAEEALRQSNIALQSRNEELDTFAHSVAHDLKNPLSTVIGYASLLRNSYTAMAEQDVRKSIQVIERIGLKMNHIVEELMLLAGLRRVQVEMEPVDMDNIVAEAQERLAHMIDEYQADIICPEDWPVALGYAPWIEEVWANYLSNAIKYGGQPPRVQLGASVRPDSRVCFWVRDNGSGLTPAAQARLFTAFERLDKVRVTGHGLGLSIVRRIVEKMEGQVEVESEGVPGKGSTFSFTLPAARQEHPRP